MNKLLVVAALLVPSIAGAQTSTGTVAGQLLTREGQPAAAVRVSAMAVPEAGVAVNNATALVSISMTDTEGRYRLENVVPGRYYIMAGFVDLPTYYPGVSDMSGAKVVDVTSGPPVTGINFSVTNTVGVTVSGRVRRATGTGSVNGQSVGMLGGNSGIQETTTAADGSFQFRMVRPGTYQLTSIVGRSNQPLTVVVADKDITGLELVVIPSVTVTGNLMVEGNATRPRVQIQLSPFKGNGQSQGNVLAADGTFRTTLPEGDYRVSWSNLPSGFEIKSLTAGNVDLLTSALKLSADAPPPVIRLVLAVEGNPWVKVSGRVTNFGSNRTLILSGPNVDQIQVTINPDGTFEIPQALPGNYTTRPNISAATPSLAMQPVQVIIPNQDTTNLIIPLPLTKDVPGIIVNTNGAGLTGRFSLNYTQRSGTSSSGGTRSMATQPDGKFSLEIPVGGDVQLMVSVPGYNVKSATYGTTDLTRQNMTVAATDTAEIRVVLDTISTSLPGAGAGGGGGFAGGGGTVLTSSLSAAPPPPTAPAASAVPASPAQTSVNRITEAIAKQNLVTSAQPAYPPQASAARVEGTVVLQVDISVEGRVQNVSVVSGNPLLNEAALQAVRQWAYKPFVLNGQSIPVVTNATVNFKLP